MPGRAVVRLVTKRERVSREAAYTAATWLMELPVGAVPEHERQVMVGKLMSIAEPARDAKFWPGGFFMLSIAQTELVWDAIRALPPSDRPQQVRHAFDLVMLNLRQDTGEVMLRREEFAEKIGCAPRHVSEVMAVLERIGAVRRERRRVDGMRGPGVAVYFVNPHVGWNGLLDRRQALAAEQPLPLLELMQGGRSDAAE